MNGPFRLRIAGALGVALACAVGLGWSPEASAKPPDERPWGRGVSMPRFGVSPWGLFNDDIGSLSFGLGYEYFLVNGLSLGLDLTDTIFIYRTSFKATYPGIETELPTNMLELLPRLRYVFYRSRWFSPYVRAGVGPVFFNNGAGTHARWDAEPGVLINLHGNLFLSLGVGFWRTFPNDRCTEALTLPSGDMPGDDLCAFGWAPRLGFVAAFGGRRRASSREGAHAEPTKRHPPPPARTPLDEAVQPAPAPTTERTPSAATPAPTTESTPAAATPAPTTEPAPSAVTPPTTGPTPPAANATPTSTPPSDGVIGSEPAPTDVPSPPDAASGVAEMDPRDPSE